MVLHFGKLQHLSRTAAVRALLGELMKAHDMVSEPIDNHWIEAARLGQRLEQQRLIEAPHHDDPFDRLALPRKADGTCRGLDQRANIEIKIGCRAPVQRQFSFAGPSAQLRGREVEIGVFYGALHLVDAVARDKDPGGMGFDGLDPIDTHAVRRRVLQERDGRLLVACRHPLSAWAQSRYRHSTGSGAA